ncbi:MAG: response regulator [Chloroflexi bacterium]|nr:response regulator [Chloroflexota bacterium]
MHSFYDYKRFAILYVDDEDKSLKFFRQYFDPHFRIFTALNALEGFRILEEHKDEIGLLITDQRMPGEKGVQLLEKARQLRPRIVRILVTAYSDLDAAIAAVNTGAIYKYITKPWDVPQLETTMRRALEFFMVQRERDQLLREKLSVLHNMMITDRVVSLGILAAGLGHHIRNSLMAIRTFLDLAPTKLAEENVDLDELHNPNFWRDFYGHVQTQVKRITELLNNLGLAAETSSLLFQDEIRLDAFMAGVLEQMKSAFESKKITVENRIPGDLPALLVDQHKFRRLFELLFNDEIVTLPEGGQITLTASPVPAGGPAAEIQLSIQDNGQGLPQEALRSVFDPFFLRQDNPKEFGINLMACYFIVYHHGGRIEVKGQEGQGTHFVLTLPTNPQSRSFKQNEQDFLSQVLLNETLWEKLLAGN